MNCKCNQGVIYCHCGVMETMIELLKQKAQEASKFMEALKKSETCGFCPEPCGNEWCCMKDEE